MQQTIKGFVADHLGDLSPADIPNFLFALFLSAALNFLLAMLYRKYGTDPNGNVAKSFVLMGMGSAVLAAIVKHSLPLALAAIALLSIIRVHKGEVSLDRMSYLFFSILIGIACGAGYGIIIIMAFAVIALFIIVLGRSNKSSE